MPPPKNSCSNDASEPEISRPYFGEGLLVRRGEVTWVMILWGGEWEVLFLEKHIEEWKLHIHTPFTVSLLKRIVFPIIHVLGAMPFLGSVGSAEDHRSVENYEVPWDLFSLRKRPLLIVNRTRICQAVIKVKSNTCKYRTKITSIKSLAVQTVKLMLSTCAMEAMPPCTVRWWHQSRRPESSPFVFCSWKSQVVHAMKCYLPETDHPKYWLDWWFRNP